MRFYLGTHIPSWLQKADMPLFVSDRVLESRKTLKPSVTDWALDSGGFSELSMYGDWTVEPIDYAKRVRRYAEEIGRLEFAAIQDWMCEPFILDKTGLTLAEHQRFTIDSYDELTAFEPDLPWLPVLQGFESDDYMRCLDGYRARGFDNTQFGIGSVCRRQSTSEAEAIIRRLAAEGLRLHAFGFKTRGLARVSSVLASADSMAWSFEARYLGVPAFPWCTHINCANCYSYADMWYHNLLATF